MRLVNDKQPHALGHGGQHLDPKLIVGQALWRYQEKINFVGAEFLLDSVPVVHVGAVDRCRAHADAGRRFQLIAHESQ